MGLKHYLSDVACKRRTASPLIKAGLTSLSYLYRAALHMRHAAYDRKWLPVTKLSRPVISVGNIAVGGTGKTPFVQLLASVLQPFCRVAILSRGYGSQIERSGKSVKVASGGKPFFTPKECGDEPFCLGQQTSADIWIGRDRVLSGQRAIEAGAECLLLDDGLQHRRLHRDWELILIDGQDPFAQGEFLPHGWLRDLPTRLGEADLLIANPLRDLTAYKQKQTLLKSYTEAPLLAVYPELVQRQVWAQKRVSVFCGLGRPERFIHALKEAGCTLVDTLFLLDHQRPTEAELSQFAKASQKKGADCILCTRKDWVKLREDFVCALPIVAVDMQLKISEGQEHWDTLIDNILKMRA